MRIATWWSFYIDAADEKEVRTAIKDIEALLGHPIQIEDINDDEFVQNYAKSQGRNWLYQVEAWSVLETKTIEQATVHTLKQVQKLDSQLSTYTFRRPTLGYQWDGFANIYWWQRDQGRTLPQFLSSGVELAISFFGQWDKEGCHDEEEDKEDCLEYLERKQTRPIITLPCFDNKKANYIALYKVGQKSSTKQKLLDLHWPKLQQQFSSKVTMTDLQKRPFNKGAFQFTVCQELEDITEDQAIATVLSVSGGLVKIECDDTGRMTWFGTADNEKETDPDKEGILGFSLERKN